MAGAEAGTPPMEEPSDPGPGSAPPIEGAAPASVAPPRRPRPVFLVVGLAAAVALAIGLFTGVGVHTTPGQPSGGRPQPGDPAPTFSLPRLGGGAPVGVPADGGASGRPAVVLFFAHWCPPCKAELPKLAAAYRQEQATGSRLARVALIGVDAEDPAAKGLAFARSAGVTFPVGSDPHGTLTEGTFDFNGLPEAVFVNGDGTVAAVHYGPVTAAQLAQWQQRLLTKG